MAPSAGALRLTDSGSSRAAELLAEEQAAWGLGSAEAALDAFLALDQRMKDIVTAWQMRDADAPASSTTTPTPTTTMPSSSG